VACSETALPSHSNPYTTLLVSSTFDYQPLSISTVIGYLGRTTNHKGVPSLLLQSECPMGSNLLSSYCLLQLYCAFHLVISEFRTVTLTSIAARPACYQNPSPSFAVQLNMNGRIGGTSDAFDWKETVVRKASCFSDLGQAMAYSLGHLHVPHGSGGLDCEERTECSLQRSCMSSLL